MFKIKDVNSGRYALAGLSKFTKYGKTWSSAGALKRAIVSRFFREGKLWSQIEKETANLVVENVVTGQIIQLPQYIEEDMLRQPNTTYKLCPKCKRIYDKSYGCRKCNQNN